MDGRRAVVGAGLALAAAWLGPLFGCVTPTLELRTLQTPVDFGYRGGEGRRARVAEPFLDERVRDECAAAGRMRRTSSRWQLLCSEAPPRWFASRLAAALEAAGFEVIRGSEPAAGDIVEIQGTLRALEIEAVPAVQTGFIEGDVSIDLRVSTPSGLSAKRSFYIKSASAAHGTKRQDVLDASVSRALREMTAAILSLTNRYPSVGRHAAGPKESGG